MTCSAIDRDANKSKRRAVDMRNQGKSWVDGTSGTPRDWLLTRVCVLFLINDDRPIDDKMRWVAKKRGGEGFGGVALCLCWLRKATLKFSLATNRKRLSARA